MEPPVFQRGGVGSSTIVGQHHEEMGLATKKHFFVKKKNGFMSSRA